MDIDGLAGNVISLG